MGPIWKSFICNNFGTSQRLNLHFFSHPHSPDRWKPFMFVNVVRWFSILIDVLLKPRGDGLDVPHLLLMHTRIQRWGKMPEFQSEDGSGWSRWPPSCFDATAHLRRRIVRRRGQEAPECAFVVQQSICQHSGFGSTVHSQKKKRSAKRVLIVSSSVLVGLVGIVFPLPVKGEVDIFV